MTGLKRVAASVAMDSAVRNVARPPLMQVVPPVNLFELRFR